MSCALILPAGFIYRFKKSKNGALAGMAVGTVLMAVAGVVMNALVMIPFYSNFMPIETIIKAGAAVNPAVSSVWTLAIFCVGPFNLVKGALTSMITAVIYKRISVLIHGASGAYGVKKEPFKKGNEKGSIIEVTNYLTKTHSVYAKENMRLIINVDTPDDIEPYYTVF